MTQTPSPFALLFAAVISQLLPFSVVVVVTGLGSASTIAISYGSNTVCGVLAGETNQRVECYKGGRAIAVEPNISFALLSGGRDFFCGLKSDGVMFLCWDGSSFVPKRVYFNSSAGLRDLSVGDDHVCGVENVTGVAKCWYRGEDESKRGSFVAPNGVKFASITSGRGFSCGVLMDDIKSVRCWGNSSIGLDIEKQFRNVSMLSLVAGDSHVCGLNVTGYLVCNGRNDSGQLDVPKGSSGYGFEFDGLAMGVNHSCAIRSVNGTVVCWGGNAGFELEGNGVGELSFESIVAGVNITCGLTTRNLSVVCWGPGSNRTMGDLPLQKIIPGQCVQGSCSCGVRQNSRAMRRQRSGTSSKHGDRAEEFSLSQLANATNNFSLENRIGSGSFGTVYKGKLFDGREVAIKRGDISLKLKKLQDKENAFQSELAFLSRLHHKHLVGFVGFCEEKEERLLVYEFMKNGALYDHLHLKENIDKASSILNSWKVRIKIALDAARGIEYLHSYAVPPIIHRDIKSSNILLDANWTARVSDFGLSLMGPESEDEYMVTKAAGTVGYMDPEYYELNVLTVKSDVYSFGVVLLELLTGKRAILKNEDEEGPPINMAEFIAEKISVGELERILDPRVGLPDKKEMEAVELLAYMALHCVNLEGRERPSMNDIVANLERALALCDDSHGSISSISISIGSE
ncbi:hypothetical protein GIB67_027509 [Kingdonia uniflora]|uniref:non-specific serine/threonine protein kinase n=1 Tax=Kingdonia uniflora TaxID=39325 RepID=A0A7J7MFP9_9MAGN|nr:hypothetical protein GIB67_027509 [Kingdonia uniflora]